MSELHVILAYTYLGVASIRVNHIANEPDWTVAQFNSADSGREHLDHQSAPQRAWPQSAQLLPCCCYLYLGSVELLGIDPSVGAARVNGSDGAGHGGNPQLGDGGQDVSKNRLRDRLLGPAPAVDLRCETPAPAPDCKRDPLV